MSNAAGKFLLLLGLLVLSGCASVAPVVKVGLIAPFEGRYRAVGYDAIYSARLAVREINQAGGIGGYRVALVTLDDGGHPEGAMGAAASLVIDPDVVAVVGHFLPETTSTAASLYSRHGLALLPAGEPPFAPVGANTLPPDFRQSYAAVTPFDEIAGPYAGPTYDAFRLLWSALALAEETTGSIDRVSVQKALGGLEYEGITGLVFQP